MQRQTEQELYVCRTILMAKMIDLKINNHDGMDHDGGNNTTIDMVSEMNAFYCVFV